MSCASGAGSSSGRTGSRVSACAGALLVLLSGCGGGGTTTDTDSTGTGRKTTPAPSSSAAPTTPTEQREQLADLSAARMCSLTDPAELRELAFAVRDGQPEEVSFDPPVRGCRYGAEQEAEQDRSVLVAAQPDGFEGLGSEPVSELAVTASMTSYANDCTVYSDVAGATLQVVVSDGDSGTERCEAARRITRRVLGEVAH
ncbi:DUF3558 domain-containing protein [Actinopolyspora erythraea]|uniref:DUF3558 domain-containing protein n=1 Tax=Actinopolyspora erythraea TaxID=414996 RepID=A0A099DA45_9ACTN|nr:DUF3558 family protein [Actinopolyspora erythraea]ASU81310.1 DUF3558 domain-containing protein [Actinopolyspora erythraea]KGI82647.1 hypothetical protein IL38_04300 [Actinopolyspora erythraea]